jgi:hypothetical protein
LFDIPECRFALAGEELADAAAQALLDPLVRIKKRQPQPPCEMAPDSGLATAGHADQEDARGGALW